MIVRRQDSHNRWTKTMAVWALLVVPAGPAAMAQESAAQRADGDLLEPDGEANDGQMESTWFGLKRMKLTEPLVTDRPDFTESTEAVPPGYVQLEFGYQFTYDREGQERVRDHNVPLMLWRIGVVENLELRINWNGHSYNETQTTGPNDAGRTVTVEEWNQGAFDLSFGAKYKFIEQDGWVPNFGVIAELGVPTGSAGYSSGDVEPAVKLLWAYDLSEKFSVAGNVNLLVPVEDGASFFQTQASITGAYAITDHIGAFIEYFGIYPNAIGSDAAHYIDGGMTYLITDNFQLDWYVGFGLNDEADDMFTGVGFSWRF